MPRGPVIGPMVLAGVVIEEEKISSLKALGVRDSKLLTPNQREALYDKIIKTVKNHKIIIISPQEIDNAVEDKNVTLNGLEAIKFAQLINALKSDIAIVDCPSTNIKAYTEQLKLYLKEQPELRCEHKGERHPPVAAASILAKVTRDREVEKIKKKYNIECGSGYPNDPLCKDFLKENWDKYPEIMRKSWSTYKAYAEGKKQTSLKEF
ncbi:MAG TPA: ribonuclease HII [Candidatus Nanoarchaeia archaeon]|nr:ribonuclease HII [Candidatus Nanoarchaeia archaeon]